MEEYLDFDNDENLIEFEPEFSNESNSDNFIKSECEEKTVVVQTKRNRALEKIDAEILRINALRAKSSNQEGQTYKYYCSFCDSKFLFKNTYEKHLLSHQDENPVVIYQCNVCSGNFESEADLKEHKIMVHKDEISMHTCRYCDRRFPDIEKLNSHYSNSHFKKHPENQLVCDICDRNFAKISDLKIHMKTHIQYLCECCKKEFISVECLEQHEKLHKTEDLALFQCLKCCDQFETPGDVLQHILEVHSQPEIPCCTVCSKTFDSENLLDYHMRLHFGQKPYQCEICEKRFGLKEQFNCHVKGHFGEKPYQCIECLKCFSRSDNFRDHQNQHRLKNGNDSTPEEGGSLVENENEENQWQCEKCWEILSTVFELHKHDQRVHQGGDHCLLCSAKFTTYSALIVHLRRKLNIKRFECSECGKKFTESNGLTRHLFTHLKDRPFKCDECPKTFSSRTELIKHQKSHSINGNGDEEEPIDANGECSGSGNSQLHECSECGWLTTTIQGMKLHMKQRHLNANENNSLTCEYCGKSFATKSTLANHIKRTHEDRGDYTCETCGNKFNTLFSLQAHSRIHQKSKEWSCLKCILIFDSEETYNEHIQQHQMEIIQQSYSKKTAYKDKPMNCDVCGRKCRGKWWLENHMKTHTGEKPFKCDFQGCDKAFTNNNNLKVHMKTHGEKCHQCKICNKLFSERKSLKLHSFLHTGQRPFQCDICGKGFITNHFLKKHILVHVKSGETKANFPESKREMIQRQQQLKLIQAQIKHGPTEDRQMDSSYEERFAINGGSVNQNQGLTTTPGSKPFEFGENNELDFNEDDIIVYDKSNEIKDAVNYFVVEETENQTFIPSRNVPIMENKCQYCNLNFETQKLLAEHVETHTERPFKCEICQYRFNMKSKLDRHMKIHLNLKPFKCNICEWSFIEAYTLKQHMLIHSGHKKPLKCEICGLGFRQKSSLNAHKFNCLKLKQEQGIEIKEFGNLDEVRNLNLNDQQETDFVIEECSFIKGYYQCGYCDKEFKSKDSLVGHLKVHKIQQKSEIMKFKCSFCDFETTNKGSYVWHTKTVHENQNEPGSGPSTLTKEEQNQKLTCHICSKLIKRMCMNKHLEQVHSKCYYRCPELTCRKLFKTLERIKEHVGVRHPVDGGTNFKCKNCPKSFSTEKALNRHSKSHVGDNQECDICGMIFSSASNIKRHKMRHFPSEKQFECKLCKEKFFTKQSKQSHVIRYHESNINVDEFE